jgi:hypothetical protein
MAAGICSSSSTTYVEFSSSMGITISTKEALLIKLEQLDQEILHFSHDDRTTNTIKTWKEAFKQALSIYTEDNAKEIQEHFFAILKERILVDSLTLVSKDHPNSTQSLDKEAFLGTDGRVYGKKSLSIALATIDPEILHTRFPVDFLVEPHQPCRFLIDWLNELNLCAPCEIIEHAYDSLFQGKEPILPLKEDPIKILQKFSHELKKIEKFAFENAQEDTLTPHLTAWIRDFGSIIRGKSPLHDLQPLLFEKSKELQTRLSAVGDRAFVGSDHQAYGFMELSTIVSSQDWPYTACPHYLARYLANWLKKTFNLPVEETKEIQEEFAKIKEPKKIPVIETKTISRLRAILDERKSKIEAAVEEEISAHLAPLTAFREKIPKIERELLEKIRVNTLEKLDQKIQEIRSLRKTHETVLQSLKTHLQSIETRVTYAKAHLSELEKKVNELEEAIDDSEDDNILFTIAVVAFSIAFSYALSYMVAGPEMFSGFELFSSPEGFSFKAAIPL